jgi:multimeric flavodoxin WrbA
MKIFGISGSPRPGAATDQLVQAVLSGVEGCETEFVSLSGIHRLFGSGTQITPEITPSLEKQEEKIDQAKALGRLLSERLFAATRMR